MLSQSNIDVPSVLQAFKDRGIQVGFLVPTETGLQKSIMDAHDSLRRFFASSGFHDYEKQLQGGGDKRIVPTTLWSRGGVVDTKTSLYRPETKNGDPRIWVYELSRHANPGDLLAIARYENKLLVINCSQCDLNDLLSESHKWMTSNFPVTKLLLSPVAEELLSKLSELSKVGWIKTLRKGDTGIGFTLESMLGIVANSSKSPDYKGIELKSGRLKNQRKTQATVFSQVPNWKISTLKGSRDILEKRGRYSENKGRIQLFHEISCLKPNSYDLQLNLESGGAQLDQVFIRPDGKIDKDVSWLMEKLISRVEEKHAESMWVSAENRGKGEAEEFWYRKVKHTKGVDAQALPILL